MENMIQFLAKELSGGNTVTQSHLDAAKQLLKAMGLKIKNQDDIKAAFKKTNFSLDFGDEYLNISRPDGMHCEFYGDGEFNYLTATYTIDGKVKECDYFISDEDSLDEFVSDVKKILK